MRPAEFEGTPEFVHFKTVMKRVLAVPKQELDELIGRNKKESPRKDERPIPVGKVKGGRKRRPK